MPMKVKDEKEPPERAKQMPYRNLERHRKDLPKLFNDMIQQQWLSATFKVEAPYGKKAVPSGHKQKVKKAAASPKVVPIKPPPNVVPFVREVAKPEVEVKPAANDDIAVGGGGRCQDSNRALAAWLAAHNPIPVKPVLLKDKEHHIRASQNSQRVRLAKYGSTDYRPEAPPWPCREIVKGWFGTRPPTLDMLFSCSRRIAEELPYQLDLETKGFIVNNIGKTFTASPTTEVDNAVMECGTIEEYDDYLGSFPDIPYLAERRWMCSIDDISQRAVVQEEVPHYDAAKAAGYTSFCTSCVAVSAAKELYARSFTDERTANKRIAKRMAISYKDLQLFDSPMVSEEYSGDDDLRAAWMAAEASVMRSEPQEESPKKVMRNSGKRSPAASDMAQKDREKYDLWLNLKERANAYNTPTEYRHPTYFDLIGSRQNDVLRYQYWLSIKDALNELTHYPWTHVGDSERYELYWLRKCWTDDAVRYDCHMSEMPNGHVVLETDEMSEWAALMSDDAVDYSQYATFIPKEEWEAHLENNRGRITQVVARNAMQRIKEEEQSYFDLKRGFKKFVNKLKGDSKTSPENSWLVKSGL